MNTSIMKLLIITILLMALCLNLGCSKDDNPVEQGNLPPSVEIVSPLENSIYLSRDTIIFNANFTGLEDAEINDSSLEWTSSQDGQIGFGKTFQIDSLTVNTHQITLTVTDSNGDVLVDTVTITILSNNLPVVTITSPNDSSIIILNDTITFTCIATDLEDSILTGSSLVWTSDIDGIIGTGTTITRNDLSENLHTISLTATDSDNNIITKSITIRTTISWERSFGGTGSDEGKSVYETSDGGFIISGRTNSSGAGNYDFILIKTDHHGNLVWEKTFGGSDFDAGHSVCESSDGGYVVTGRKTFSSGEGRANIYLLKTDINGNIVWEKSFGGFNSESAYSLKQTNDDGFIITGFTDSYGEGSFDVILIKTDNTGDLVWQKTYGGTKLESGRSVFQTSDGGYVITGSTYSFGAGDSDLYLIKTDSIGNLVWQNTFGGTPFEIGYSVIECSDGNFLITGTSPGYLYLVKTDNSGNLVWEKNFGRFTASSFGSSVRETSDGNYIIAGITSVIGNGQDVYLFKTDTDGNTIWEKTIGGINGEGGRSVRETSDGGFIITGWKFADNNDMNVYLVKTDSEGNVY